MKLFQNVPVMFCLFALIITACGGGDVDNPFPEAAPMISASPKVNVPAFTTFPTAILNSPGSESSEVVPEKIIEQVKTDLVDHLGISENQVQLMDAQAVTWPDASIGCPQPGMVYAQVPTPGYWIVLEAVGQKYEYHFDKMDVFILCGLTAETSNRQTDSKKNVVDGWPNQTKDKDVIIAAPTKKQ